MTEKTIKAFDQICDAVTAHDDRMTRREYLELLDEVRVFVAIRQDQIKHLLDTSNDPIND